MEKCLPLLPRETFHKILVWHFQPPPQNTLSFNGRYVAVLLVPPHQSLSFVGRVACPVVLWYMSLVAHESPIYQRKDAILMSYSQKLLMNGPQQGTRSITPTNQWRKRRRTRTGQDIGTSAPTTASSAHPLFVTISVPPCMHPSTKYNPPPPARSPSKYSVAGNVKLIIYIHGNSTEIKYKDAPWRYPQWMRMRWVSEGQGG